MSKWEEKIARADLVHLIYGCDGMNYDEMGDFVRKVVGDEMLHLGKCHACGKTANGFGWAQGNVGPAVVGALCYDCRDRTHEQPDGWPAVHGLFFEIWRTVARCEPPPKVRDLDLDKVFWTRTFDPATGALGPNERRKVGCHAAMRRYGGPDLPLN